MADLALVAASALFVATLLHPKVHDALTQSITNVIESVSEMSKSGTPSQKYRKTEQAMSTVQFESDDMNGRGPWQIDCKGKAGLICIATGTVVMTAVINMLACGRDDCSEAPTAPKTKSPIIPTATSTSTSTMTATIPPLTGTSTSTMTATIPPTSTRPPNTATHTVTSVPPTTSTPVVTTTPVTQRYRGYLDGP